MQRHRDVRLATLAVRTGCVSWRGTGVMDIRTARTEQMSPIPGPNADTMVRFHSRMSVPTRAIQIGHFKCLTHPDFSLHPRPLTLDPPDPDPLNLGPLARDPLTPDPHTLAPLTQTP